MFSEKEVFTWCCFGIEVVPSNVSGTKLIIKLWQNIRYNLRNFFRGSVQNDLISKIRFSPLFCLFSIEAEKEPLSKIVIPMTKRFINKREERISTNYKYALKNKILRNLSYILDFLDSNSEARRYRFSKFLLIEMKRGTSSTKKCALFGIRKFFENLFV